MLRVGRRGLVQRLGIPLPQLLLRGGCIASRCLSLFSNGMLIFHSAALLPDGCTRF